MSDRVTWQVTDDAAVIYEQSFVPALFAGAAVVLADAAGIDRGERVLDVGCGTGAVTREAARRAGAEGRVVGLDLNPRMLAVAERVAPEIEWRQGDAGNLPFEDAAFDVVVSQFALMFCPDQAGALRGMWRVLAPGGRLARSRSAGGWRTAPATRRSRRSRNGSASPRSSICCTRPSRSATGHGWRIWRASPGSTAPTCKLTGARCAFLRSMLSCRPRSWPRRSGTSSTRRASMP